jgi:3-hydroxyisobutyrate dehydrogenase-like beta-hydroxyacid dehydrogenase
MKPTVGLIGLGLMGKPNLLRAGFPLVVWNRTSAKAADLVLEGAKLAANPRDTAEQADLLITIVSDPKALEYVIEGPNGALEGLRRGSVLVDCSTVSPDLARREAVACAERGIDFLDAPVTGGTWGAEKGELVFMIGGKAEVLERVKPVFEAMGKRWFLLGPAGSGQTVKLAIQLIIALEVDALAEGMALVTSVGLSGAQLIEVLQSSMGRAAVLDVKAPLILKNDFPPSFPLRLMHKDLRLALELAQQAGIELPAAAAAFSTYSIVNHEEKDDIDFSAVARFWKKAV